MVTSERRPATVYRAPVSVDRMSERHYVLTTSPPLHSASVRLLWGQWVTRWHTDALMPARRHVSAVEALRATAPILSTRAGYEWHTGFTGAQRTHIGQQRCPKIKRGGVLCGVTATVGTIMCPEHDNRRM